MYISSRRKLHRTLYIERRIIVNDTFVRISSFDRSVLLSSFFFFFIFIFTRNDAAEFCASRFVIIVYPYRAVTAGSNSFVPLGHGVAPRYRDAGEFRLDDFARGRTARMELSIRRRLCSFLLIRRCLEKQKISAKEQVTVTKFRINYLLQIEVTCPFLFFYVTI